MRDLQEGIVESTFLTPAEFRRYIELFNQTPRDRLRVVHRRCVSRPRHDRRGCDLRATTRATRLDTRRPETVDLEYVELSLADIAATVDVSDEALRKAYDEERDRFQSTEERHARHILIAVDKGDEDAARAKAGGDRRARCARARTSRSSRPKYPHDAGTKAQGGDLGWMTPRDAAVRERAVRHASRRDQRPGPQRFRLSRDQARRGPAGHRAPVRGGSRRARRATCARARPSSCSTIGRTSSPTARSTRTTSSRRVANELEAAHSRRSPTSRARAIRRYSATARPWSQAAFDEQNVDSGRNSSLIELADDQVARAARDRTSCADGQAARGGARSDSRRAQARARARSSRSRPRRRS